MRVCVCERDAILQLLFDSSCIVYDALEARR